MKWFNIYKDGQPNSYQRVLTYSANYRDTPEMAFRIMDGQFVRLCREVTDYMYLFPPDEENRDS